MIKERLKKVPWLYFMLKIFKNRKNNKYIKSHFDFDNNSNIITLEKNQNNDNNDIVCEIITGKNNEGFFATIRWALDGLYFCDYYSLKAVIKFADNSLYKDSEYDNKRNPFDYYYKQPFEFSTPNLYNPGTIIKLSKNNYKFAEEINKGMNYEITEEYINNMALIMKKYLKFNDETEKKISDEIIKRKISNTTLGVHIRGTDYKKNYKDHPIYINVEYYYNYIDEALRKFKFDKIFVATDDQEILKKIIEHYGEDMIIYSKDTLRGNGSIGVHVNKTNRKYHRYLLGLEVIFDMCSLASCGGIITGMSQVGLITRIYKKSKDENYIYDKILNKGINEKGKLFRV